MTLFSRVFKQVVPLSLLLLCGCATGAMRIDVDVYKGPLAQTSDAQFASLIGYLEETKRALIHNMNVPLMIAAHKEFANPPDKVGVVPSIISFWRFFAGEEPKQHFTGVRVESFLGRSREEVPDAKQGVYLYFPSSDSGVGQRRTISDPITWCDKLDAKGVMDLLNHSNCMMLRSVYIDSEEMLRDVDALLLKNIDAVRQQHWNIKEEQTRKLLMDVAELAVKFREKAFRWAKAHMAGASPDCRIRIAVMSFVLSASETGNQLQARADALLKQLGSRDGRDARELALSVHLQDTEPTDFVHLFEWLEASADGCGADLIRRKVLNVVGFPGINVQDRVKVLERLYGDYFWSRINTVHASGAGKTNMVFVKDGEGNWNLKNFESYPGELLEAYLNVGKKALEAAAKIAAATSGVGSGGVAIEAALKFASQSIADPPSAIAGTQLLEDLVNEEEELRYRLMAETQKAVDKEKGQADSKKAEVRKAMIEQYEKILGEFGSNMDVLKKASHPEANIRNSKETEKAIRETLSPPFARP